MRTIRRFPYVPALVLTVLVVTSGLPLYWMIASSLKSPQEIARIPSTLWPESAGFEQFIKLFENSMIGRATLNSLFISVATALLVVVFGSAAAYAATILGMRNKEKFLSLTVVTQFLPHAASLLPIFLIWSRLGLIDSLPAAVLVYFAFQLPVAVWILRGYFMAIPREIIDAAAVDGSGTIRTLLQVVMPMLSPGLAAVAIWTIIATWGELLFGLVLLNGNSRPVSVVLSGLIGEHATDFGVLMAGATVATLPPLLLFLFAQRYFVNGMGGAVKG